MKIYSFDEDDYKARKLYTTLCDASPAERENIVKQANLDLQDNYGCTALMYAVIYGNTSIAKSLIKAKADLNIKDYDGKTALVLAAERGRKDIVDSLIEAGADINIKDDNGDTALMRAIKKGKKDIVDLLIEAHIQDGSIYTALMYAVKKDRKDIVEQLVKAINQQYIKKLSEAEQKNAKLEAQQARNRFRDKKREEQRMRALRLGRYRHR